MAILLFIGLIVYLALLLADGVNRLISETMQIIMTRLLGIILAALSVQFVIDAYWHSALVDGHCHLDATQFVNAVAAANGYLFCACGNFDAAQ